MSVEIGLANIEEIVRKGRVAIGVVLAGNDGHPDCWNEEKDREEETSAYSEDERYSPLHGSEVACMLFTASASMTNHLLLAFTPTPAGSAVA